MSKQFKLTRDLSGEVSYGLSLGNMRTAGALIDEDAYCYFEIEENDQYVFFLPSSGANFMVSHEIPIKPTLLNDVEALPLNGVINVAHIDLSGWGPYPADTTKRRIYVLSLDAPMWLSVAFGGR